MLRQSPDEGQARRGPWVNRNLSGAIYGVITATAVIGATSAHEEDPRVILVTTVVTLIVFWLAHVYAEVVAHHVRGQRRPSLSVVRIALVDELPILQAPALSLLLLLAGALGPFDGSVAIDLALWAGVAQLAAWGVAYARQQGWPWHVAVGVGVVNGALGVVVILLKTLLH